MEIEEYISTKDLEKTIFELAAKIKRDLGNNIHFLTVLDGARKFSSELERALSKQGVVIINHTIGLRSYSGSESSGNISLIKDVDINISGKEILIIEDIVDTGRTIDLLKNYLLEKRGVKNVRICSLLSKPSRRVVEVKIDYLGREIPDEFVVGYGMDFDGEYRDLDYVGILREN